MCVQLDGDSSWWRSSGGHLSLQRVTALAVVQRWRRRRKVVVASLTLLPVCGGVVSCCVRCLCVVAFASARDVICYFFLNDMAALLPLISKKKDHG
jgi:chorismate mutase